jgi:3,4-dihydroxy 2-butanone 4-phosphate synthase/GTP cyclohydrolase II
MDEDGSMARTPSIMEFAKKHGLKIITIADLIEYRRKNEKLIRHRVDVNLPSKFGDFKFHLYENVLDTNDNRLQLLKNLNTNEPFCTVQSECLTEMFSFLFDAIAATSLKPHTND